MLILLGGLFLIAVALAVFALMPADNSGGGSNFKQAIIPPAESQEPLINRFQEQAQSFNLELEQLRQEHTDLNRELELANKVVFDLKEELDKLRKFPGVDNSEFDKIRKDSSLLKDEILNKSNQLEREINEVTNLIKDLKLNRESQATLEGERKLLTDKITTLETRVSEYNKQLESQKEVIQKYELLEEQVSKREYEDIQQKLKTELEKIEALNRENSDLAGKIKIFETQSGEYNKEIEQQKSIIEELKISSANNVAKEEFEQLNEKMKLEGEKLDLLKNENASLIEKIKDLELDSDKQKKEIQKQSAQAKEIKSSIDLSEFVPRKDYEALKKKLESAEEVLKIVHGAGA